MLAGDAGIFDDGQVMYKSTHDQQMIFHLILRRQLVYLVDHRLTERGIDNIIPINPGKAFARTIFQLGEAKAANLLDKSILTKFIMRKANQIHEAKLSDKPPVDLLDLSRGERVEIWRQEWAKDPKTLVADMWDQVVQHVDLEAIFNCPDHAPASVKDLMKSWRAYFFECFIEAIEKATRYRISARELPEQTRSQVRAKKRAKKRADLVVTNLWKNVTRGGGKISAPDLRLIPVTAFIREGFLYKKVVEKEAGEPGKRKRSTSPTRGPSDANPATKRQRTK
ncbi:hypothetical protein SLS58_007581 [Diplodia intermedia]|uniref:Uncharacterized protein n=1 Tax=Diplodia intermedia TaxID=856260 RepID=A0ABR3TJW8_9PEZI